MRFWFVFLTTLLVNGTAFADSSRKHVVCDIQSLKQSVKKASLQIRSMNKTYRLKFARLRETVQKTRNWSDAEFIQKARPLIQNEKINAFNVVNQKLISSISQLHITTGSSKPNCKMLALLNDRLHRIIANTENKWNFLLLQINTATQIK